LDYEGAHAAVRREWPHRATPRRLPALRSPSALAREALERLAVEPVRDPLAHRARAEAAVEGQSELIPVERRPFQARAPTRAHARGHRREQRPPHPCSESSRRS